MHAALAAAAGQIGKYVYARANLQQQCLHPQPLLQHTAQFASFKKMKIMQRLCCLASSSRNLWSALAAVLPSYINLHQTLCKAGSCCSLHELQATAGVLQSTSGSSHRQTDAERCTRLSLLLLLVAKNLKIQCKQNALCSLHCTGACYQTSAEKSLLLRPKHSHAMVSDRSYSGGV